MEPEEVVGVLEVDGDEVGGGLAIHMLDDYVLLGSGPSGDVLVRDCRLIVDEWTRRRELEELFLELWQIRLGEARSASGVNTHISRFAPDTRPRPFRSVS